MKDEAFIRGAIPMTKSEVRAVSVSRLELKPEDILYDVGAGTGSVSVEAALLIPRGRVYAFEQKEEGCSLIQANAQRHGVKNITVVQGKAPDTWEGLPAPDCIFIGGSGGKMTEVLERAFALKPSVRVVVNVIALESLHQIMEYCRAKEVEPEVSCIQVSRACVRGRYHMMEGQNPVYVISFGGLQKEAKKEEEENVAEKRQIPRILIASPASGSGKTVITAGLLSLLKKRGIACASFKCGPDYIDPMFHRQVLGIPCCNLDRFFLDREQVRNLFLEKTKEAELAVTEGAMGYYDGIGGTTFQASAWEIADITETPVILVVDGKGSSLSVAAQIHGFLTFRPDSRIEGVILNRTSPEMVKRLKPQLEALGISCIGAVPVCEEAKLESRHLGLTIPQEQEALRERLEALGDRLEEWLDISEILRIAKGAQALVDAAKEKKAPGTVQEIQAKPLRRMGVALDEAFCFYYEENLEFLQEHGWELVFFSPLRDQHLPPALDGILLGGGYPEVYAGQLSANVSLRTEIAQAAASGVKILAECGGFLYLHQKLEGMDQKFYPMTGVLEGEGFRRERMTRFGYISLEDRENGTVTGTSGSIRGHEFHYWDSTNPGRAMYARKPASQRGWDCMIRTETILAGFPHLYYRSAPEWILQFLNREDDR